MQFLIMFDAIEFSTEALIAISNRAYSTVIWKQPLCRNTARCQFNQIVSFVSIFFFINFLNLREFSTRNVSEYSMAKTLRPTSIAYILLLFDTETIVTPENQLHLSRYQQEISHLDGFGRNVVLW